MFSSSFLSSISLNPFLKPPPSYLPTTTTSLLFAHYAHPLAQNTIQRSHSSFIESLVVISQPNAYSNLMTSLDSATYFWETLGRNRLKYLLIV